MKKGKNYLHLLLAFMGMLMLLCAGMTVSASERPRVRINNVDYVFYKNEQGKKPVAIAYIDDVRGSNLPTELYIPKKIKYKKKKYEVESFVWGDLEEYKYTTAIGQEPDKPYWRPNVAIPDKKHSYQACLKKITFAKGVLVYGPAYGYEKLKYVVFEDPNDLREARFYNCPKLKRLHFTKNYYWDWDYQSFDIKNCPSLKMTIDKKHKYLKMVGNDICSKDGTRLDNVVSGKKNYKVPKGVKEISAHAFWGNTAIETLQVRKTGLCGIYGLPNLKRIKMGKEYGNEYLFLSIKYTPPIKRLNIPEDVRYVYIQEEAGDSEINHIYLYSKNLKGGDLRRASVKTTFHVRNKKVEKKLRKFGFKGKIVIEKNMK
ncbi:MAG: hypothetical protein ACLVEV_10180 [Lachnospiraceae bacterium]|uniref:hypothetical protein n=1 Tax=Parablautia sp. Marseille-Q6255 TaxID=3039593 RepID=UPI0024BCB3A8|nr:hypothetical protein [Parablautia sp. Marseille-Q6255]